MPRSLRIRSPTALEPALASARFSLAEVDLRLPFWVFSAVVLVTLVAGLAIGGRRMAALQPGAGDQAGPRTPMDEPSAAVPEAVR